MSKGADELRKARSASDRLIAAAVVFSAMVNLLMLAGPLYMLQIYDRVLGSGSEATLVALSILVIGLFLAMGILDYSRHRVMAVVGARFQDRLDGRVFTAAMQRSSVRPNDPAAVSAQTDLEAVRTFLASPVLMALMDLPWTPFFLAAIFVFHPMMGWLSVAGGLTLVGAALLNQHLSRIPQSQAYLAAIRAERTADQLKSEAETLQALGMATSGFARWRILRDAALSGSISAHAVSDRFNAVIRTFRLFLQSAMLGLGAWLVLRGELSGGAMIAGSILMGRALAPIEFAVGQWALLQRALEGWRRLAALLGAVPPAEARTSLPRPRSLLDVEGLTVGPPEVQVAVLQKIGFRLPPGQALGVIGPSGSGKSTLAKALTGVWRPFAGSIRLDGATLEQYEPDVLGRLIGYLPQRVTLFDGTVAENIARLDLEPDSARIVEAARKADAHETILRLPQGYDTPVSVAGSRLSGGQIQRIGLARALYGDPVLLVLDEPNANLDSAGSAALNTAIRRMKADGRSVLIMAHRPAAIQECDLLLVLGDGTLRAFGPRDQVLRDQVRNHAGVRMPDRTAPVLVTGT